MKLLLDTHALLWWATLDRRLSPRAKKAIALDGRPHDIACGQIDIGNTATDMASGFAGGVLQPDGRVLPEPLFDVRHVVDAVVYMAGLPLEANVPFITVMATKMPYLGRG